MSTDTETENSLAQNARAYRGQLQSNQVEPDHFEEIQTLDWSNNSRLPSCARDSYSDWVDAVCPFKLHNTTLVRRGSQLY